MKASKTQNFSILIQIILFLFYFPLSLSAQDISKSNDLDNSIYQTVIDVDWLKDTIDAKVELDIAKAGLRLPSSRYEAEVLIERAIPELARDTIKSIYFDSYRTVGDSLEDGTLDSALFEAFLASSIKTKSTFSGDLSKLVVNYEWKISTLSSLYVRHKTVSGFSATTQYSPTRTYSGIVIYLKGSFKVRGEHREAVINPCLFPRVYDENMNVISERNLVDPNVLKVSSLVAYAFDLNDDNIALRAGSDPLRIVATSIFGSMRTDAIISTADALKILCSKDNQNLIRTGKIVFIIDEPKE